MSIIPPGEKIIQTKTCRLSGQDFYVTDKDLEFYDKISPVFGGKKYSIPSPTLCPDERQKRRLAFRNERKLYKRKCDKTGKEIISIYSPDKPYVVYDQKVWWGDDWSAFDYGRNFDFEKGFFEQFDILNGRVPKLSLINNRPENSEFCNQTTGMKNSYLCCNAVYSENCYYCKGLNRCTNNIDCLRSYESELCYECIDIHGCYDLKHCFNCTNCKNLSYCFDCVGCSNCIACTGLKNKQYCIANKSYTKEQFDAYLSDIQQRSPAQMFGYFEQIRKTTPHRSTVGLNNDFCFSDCIFDSSHTHYSFDVVCAENCKYCYDLRASTKDSYDISSIGNSIESSYECVSSGISLYGSSFVSDCWENVSNTLYSFFCLYGSKNCFGSVGLRHAENAILNTPYSVQEYETLCGKIIDHMRGTGEWGEFFPHELSPFAYNETVANEYFPMTEEDVRSMPHFSKWKQKDNQTEDQLKTASASIELSGLSGSSISRGWKWYEGENRNTYIGEYYIPLPIREYTETIVGYETAKKNIDELLAGIIQCEITKKPFKIIKQELAFYIENGIPIPTKHPDQRHKERMDLRNPRKLYERTCSECGKDIITTYSPGRPEKVVCEECYRRLAY